MANRSARSSCRVAWIVGWGLILEYGVGAAAVARGISPNMVSPSGSLLARITGDINVSFFTVFSVREQVEGTFGYQNYITAALTSSYSHW